MFSDDPQVQTVSRRATRRRFLLSNVSNLSFHRLIEPRLFPFKALNPLFFLSRRCSSMHHCFEYFFISDTAATFMPISYTGSVLALFNLKQFCSVEVVPALIPRICVWTAPATPIVRKAGREIWYKYKFSRLRLIIIIARHPGDLERFIYGAPGRCSLSYIL